MPITYLDEEPSGITYLDDLPSSKAQNLGRTPGFLQSELQPEMSRVARKMGVTDLTSGSPIINEAIRGFIEREAKGNLGFAQAHPTLSRIGQMGEGAAQALTQAAESMREPQNLAMLGAGIAVPPLGVLLSTIFGGQQMGQGAANIIYGGTPEEKAAGGVQSAFGGLLSYPSLRAVGRIINRNSLNYYPNGVPPESQPGVLEPPLQLNDVRGEYQTSPLGTSAPMETLNTNPLAVRPKSDIPSQRAAFELQIAEELMRLGRQRVPQDIRLLGAPQERPDVSLSESEVQSQGQRITQPAGQPLYPTLELHNAALGEAGFPPETQEVWQKFNEDQINKYVEEPVKPLVRKVIEEGNKPTGSNAYGPGDKGVWFVTPSGDEGFIALNKIIQPQGAIGVTPESRRGFEQVGQREGYVSPATGGQVSYASEAPGIPNALQQKQGLPPIPFFNRQSEARGLGEVSTAPTLENVRRQRELDYEPYDKGKGWKTELAKYTGEFYFKEVGKNLKFSNPLVLTQESTAGHEAGVLSKTGFVQQLTGKTYDEVKDLTVPQEDAVIAQAAKRLGYDGIVYNVQKGEDWGDYEGWTEYVDLKPVDPNAGINFPERTQNASTIRSDKTVIPGQEGQTGQTALQREGSGETRGNDIQQSEAERVKAGGTTQRQDVERYNAIQKELEPLIKNQQFDSPDLQRLWKESETIKNRFGGEVPQEKQVNKLTQRQVTPEKLVAPAWQDPDTGNIYPGKVGDIHATVELPEDATGSYSTMNRGYVTQTGRFVGMNEGQESFGISGAKQIEPQSTYYFAGPGLTPAQIQLVKKGVVKTGHIQQVTPNHTLNISDPNFWNKGLGFAPDAKVDAVQLYNRVKNKLGEKSMRWELLDQTPGWKEFMSGEKRSPSEVQKWVETNGPKLETHVYGIEGKVSEAKQRWGAVQHELDTLAPGWNRQDFDPTTLKGEAGKKWDEYLDLVKKVSDEGNHLDKGPKATSYYSTVSALDTTQPMPEWTATKSDKNVQRVDVVVPEKLRTARELESGKSAISKVGDKYRTEQPLWQPDNLHENLPNTLGWAMIQYKTGPKGEKIAVIAEAQSGWGQKRREVEAKLKKADSSYAEYLARGRRGIVEHADAYNAELTTPDHPLLRDYNRLILKAVIEQARKEGATHIMLSDAETAMMTEGHDLHNKDIGEVITPREYSREEAQQKADQLTKQTGIKHRITGADTYSWAVEKPRYEVSQEPGMRLNYDTILPKIAEELTGSKGEKVSLGEHKNAYEKGKYPGNALGLKVQKRNNLMFSSSEVKGMMYRLPEQTQPTYYFAGPGLTPAQIQAGKKLVVKAGQAGLKGIQAYTQPMLERLRTRGGTVSKKVADEAQEINSQAQGFAGSISPMIDKARTEVNKLSKTSTWLRETQDVTPNAATSNFFAANEGRVAVPTEVKPVMDLLNTANKQGIGGLAQKANPQFTPTGKLQRIRTSYGYDVLLRGGGDAWNTETEAVAKLNNVPLAKVQAMYKRLKAAMDEPGFDTAKLDKINQDFERVLPKTVTHVKTNLKWHQVIVADPDAYLTAATARTAHAAAFRQVYPQGSGYLASTRKAVMAELKTDIQGKEFDNLMKTLQGHPLDVFTAGWNAPDEPLGATYRGVSQIAFHPLKLLMLTLNGINNAPETLFGGPAQFLGYKNVMQAMWDKKTLYPQLEMNGAVDRLFYRWFYDKNAPLDSLIRLSGEVVKKATAQQTLNEIQEFQAAGAAKILVDRIRGQGPKLTEYEKNRLIQVFRAMLNVSKEQARGMINNPKANDGLITQFERRSASWLTGGHQSVVEKSRLGVSRIFNELFWFQTYPQMVGNQFAKVIPNFVGDTYDYIKNPTKENFSNVYHNGVLLGRMMGGRTLQGVMVTAIMAVVTGLLYGLKEKIQEAKNRPLGFLTDSFLNGVGGPVQMAKYVAEQSSDSKSLIANLSHLSPPVTVASEYWDMVNGTGRYKGLSVDKKIATFFENKTPGWKLLKMTMGIAKLTQSDPELDVAVKAFYRWVKEQPGYAPPGDVGGTENIVKMRVMMREVKRKIEAGEDWVSEAEKVGDWGYVKDSIARGTLLDINGKKLTDEQKTSLRKRIGDKLVDRLEERDELFRATAKSIYVWRGKGR